MFLLLSKGRQCVLDDEVEQEKQVIFSLLADDD